MSDLNSVDDNKLYYANGIVQLLNVDTKEGKSLILDYANKSFDGVKKLNEIKKEQIKELNYLFQKNKNLLSEEEYIDFISQKNLKYDKVKKIFEKYDNDNKGKVSFENMRKGIKECGLNEISEEILLSVK